MRSPALFALPLLLLSGAAIAQQQSRPEESDFERKAESVVRQPLKDVGAMKEEIPPILLEAEKAPYSLAGIRGCAGYSAEIAKLTAVLGPDIDTVNEKGEPLAGRLAEEGAKSAINMLIPFRGLVREATGAAQADREMRAAFLTGSVRRGYLKGHARAKGCRV